VSLLKNVVEKQTVAITKGSSCRKIEFAAAVVAGRFRRVVMINRGEVSLAGFVFGRRVNVIDTGTSLSLAIVLPGIYTLAMPLLSVSSGGAATEHMH
jgi:hypothetical protein